MPYQKHVLEQTARCNIGTAEDFGKSGKTSEQRTLLQAALILAEKARSQRLATECRRLLAAVPAVDVVLSPLRQELALLVEELGEEYASESSDSGEIHETSAGNIEAAITECLDKSYTTRVQLPFSDFKKKRKTAAHRRLVALVERHVHQYAQAGDPECFSPEDKATPGGFSYCILIKPGDGQKNLLVRFPTAQT